MTVLNEVPAPSVHGRMQGTRACDGSAAMPARHDRSLTPTDFSALKTEVIRAAVELSDAQLMDLTDALHSVMRLRRPGRPIGRPTGWLEDESPYIV